jgi:peptide/nickel transport system substrate-binding protein
MVAAMLPAFALTSCTKTETTAAVTTSTTSANAPKTGGSITVWTWLSTEPPSGFDSLTTRIWSGSVWINPFTEWLCRGDIEKFGPGGSNAFGFNTFENIPEQYLTGELATSWEWQSSPLTLTFHLRQGVMFTGNKNINMAARELTADDVVYSLMRTKNTAGPGSYLKMIDSVTATDKYTAVVHLNAYDANWFFIFGGGMAMGAIQPHEMAEANKTAEDWHNAVGTGPYILSDYVEGSTATYTKNPNYWGKTTIDGVSYQLPFIDTVYYPIMPDPSTMLAALRTGQIDWDPRVDITYENTLKTNVPDLTLDKYLNGKIDGYRINRQGSKTLKDVNVRRALEIGLDLQNISNLMYGGGEINSWPIGPQVPGYTKTADLPASNAELLKYDPVKAKAMLATAGYPSGFSVEIDAASSDQHSTDSANLMVSMWAKIGVTATIKVLDPAAGTSARDQVTYPDMLWTGYTVVNPLVSLHLVQADILATNYLNTEPFNAQWLSLASDMDPVSRTTKIHQLSLDFMNDVGLFPFAQSYMINAHWPWLKNYNGELDSGYYNQMAMIKRMWIDPSIKTKLGK